MVRQLGIGVLGLQEGRTLVGGLNGVIPAEVGTPLEKRYRAPHARAVAGCDLRPEKLDAVRQDFPEMFLTQDYDAMLARDDVAIVAVYTPDQFHGEHIVQAFEAGKDVICTKPLTNNLDDARRILEAGRRTGQKLLVGQSTRFFESFRRQRAAYERGEIGEIEFLDAHYNHRMDWYYDKSPWATEATDWVFLGMSHPIDLVRWYLGPIAEVQALGAHSALARRYHVKSHDIYSATYRAADGRIGRALSNFGLTELPSARNAAELVLYGSDGTSMAQYHDMRFFHTQPDGTEVVEDMLYHWRPYHFNNEVHGMHYGEFANYAEYFAVALLEGRDYSPNLEEGVETVCLMEATRRAAAEGRPVQVAPLLEEVGLA